MGAKRTSENYSKAQIARRAKQSPEELSALGKTMAVARWKDIPPKKRSKIMKKIRNGNKN